MVNIQAYVQAVHNLTAEATSKDLAHFCRKWLEETGEKISTVEADRVISTLIQGSTQASYTLGIITILLAKLSKIKAEADILEYVRQLESISPTFEVQQLHWAPDIYDRLFENLGQLMLKKNLAIWGIPVLENAIRTYTRGNPSHLTNLHSMLFCLCLKAQHFDRTLPFLKIDVTKLFKQTNGLSSQNGQAQNDNEKVSSSENSSQSMASTPAGITSSAVSFLKNAVNTMSGSFGLKSEDPKPAQPLFKRRNILLYFYYGAMIFGALEEWEDAVLFLEHAICLPAKRCSAIVLEAIKKYYIISLIIGRKRPLQYLPTYRTPVIQRNLQLLANIYTKLPNLIQQASGNKQDVVTVLTVYLDEKRTQFVKDHNVGLMKVLINTYRENSVKRLGNIFVSLHLNDVARMAYLPIPANDQNIAMAQDNVEQIILRLCRNGQLNAQIDGRTQTVIFDEKADGGGANSIKTKYSEESIDTAMDEVIELAHTIHAFDEAIRLNPHFIEKSQKSKDRMPGGGNGGAGTSSSAHAHSIFPEDEGFFLTGSP